MQRGGQTPSGNGASLKLIAPSTPSSIVPALQISTAQQKEPDVSQLTSSLKLIQPTETRNYTQAEDIPIERTWIDRVLDAVMGEAEGPQHKYALICENCFQHNGLVLPMEYPEAKFKCISCGHLTVKRCNISLSYFHTSPSSPDLDCPSPVHSSVMITSQSSKIEADSSACIKDAQPSTHVTPFQETEEHTPVAIPVAIPELIAVVEIEKEAIDELSKTSLSLPSSPSTSKQRRRKRKP